MWEAIGLRALVVGAVAMIAAPTALSAKPTRTVISPLEPISLPAGLGCDFPVYGQPDPRSRNTIFEFTDSESWIIGHANATLTNLDTGTSIVWRSRYRITESSGTGRFFFLFFPGDQGPFGQVGEPGALFGLVGHFESTVDPDTDLITSFTLHGQATDLCALLSA